MYTGFWWGNPKERDHLAEPGVEGRILLRWILRKWNVGVWTGSSWLTIEAGGDTYECGDEPSGFAKCGEFLD